MEEFAEIFAGDELAGGDVGKDAAALEPIARKQRKKLFAFFTPVPVFFSRRQMFLIVGRYGLLDLKCKLSAAPL